jgi:DNA-binding Lrp family transcriptional regulator
MNSSQYLIELLSDEYMLKILYATNDRARSITQLSEDFDIPITACYRRIENLRDKGLVFEDGTKISEKGRRIKLYRSAVSKIDVHFENGKMVFEISTEDGEKKARELDVLTDMDMECEPPSVIKDNVYSKTFFHRIHGDS